MVCIKGVQLEEIMRLKEKEVLVVGLGKSGIAACGLLKQMGARVSLYDGNENLEAPDLGVPVYLGDYPADLFAAFDCAVFSPGVPTDIPLALFLEQNGVPVIGEIELAYLMERGHVVGITGTNGKTTTTTLVGEIIKAYNENTFVVGNIGNPYTKEVLKSSKESVTVAEISSFQLETVETFAPDVSAVLNITPDHLDRNKTMENYIDAKMNITRSQNEKQLCVLNYEDSVLRERASGLPCRVAFFSSKGKPESQTFPEGKYCPGMYKDAEGNLCMEESGKVLLNQKETRLPGDHNAENMMAALLIAFEMGVPEDTAVRVVKQFSPVEHRVEFVRTLSGVDYYNDSKGTNPDAAIKGIQSMDRQTVLIGGGYDKGGDFGDWIRSFNGKVKKLLLLGATREKIADDAKKNGFTEYQFVDSLEEAVRVAHGLAKEGDAVLLSPACASWDMFKSYEERGNLFKDYVNALS